jgi:hypothetical protein
MGMAMNTINGSFDRGSMMKYSETINEIKFSREIKFFAIAEDQGSL